MSSGVGGKYELSPSCILNAALHHAVACSGVTLRIEPWLQFTEHKYVHQKWLFSPYNNCSSLGFNY